MKYTYSENDLRIAVASSASLRQVLQKLNIIAAGGNYQTTNKRIKNLNIDTSHFTQQSWSKGKIFGPKRPIEDYLSNKFPAHCHRLKQRLIKEHIFKHECMKCTRKKWFDIPIPLELHHIDGNHENNSKDNLQLLCPNCHALTDNYRARKT